MVITAIILLCTLFVLARGLSKLKYKSLKFLRGPPSPSWLFGHEYTFFNQAEVSGLSNSWIRDYGTALRLGGPFGKDILFLADPKALQHILHTSSYHYPKPLDMQDAFLKVFGKTIVTTEGNVHQRQRKALNPAFSASQLKTFLSVFQRSTQHLTNKWQEKHFMDADEQGYCVINTTRWFSRLALDIIGESAFDYKFGALDEDDNVLSSISRDLFKDTSGPELSKTTMFFRLIRRQLLDLNIYNLLKEMPFVLTKEDKRFNTWLETATDAAKNILNKKAQSGYKAEEGDKDILSVLVRSNTTQDPKKRLDDKEMLDHMATIILAGHETTSNTTTWLFYELSRHPEHQGRILKELDTVKKRKLDAGEDEALTAHDYDSMPFLNACIKEALRLYPIIPHLVRCSERDDVIPLSEPAISVSGEKMTQIPVKKGQRIIIDIPSYNRLKSVWSEDPDTWNPERFLDSENQMRKDTTLGVYANLMSFSGGVRGCIGWRFALIEMQTILIGLLSTFEFSIDPKLEFFRGLAGSVTPVLKGKEAEGPQMPLKVRLRTAVRV
ncbi:hypothetical protein VKT23_017552 [Stygiomarasmius scandens]|uniref:Cytochrome P450 n=1 Tax=Marasmiellus scandens TaxID=2682957 RepID=A0ABR1IVX4_9AGAR